MDQELYPTLSPQLNAEATTRTFGASTPRASSQDFEINFGDERQSELVNLIVFS
jgi:hypothetical protein